MQAINYNNLNTFRILYMVKGILTLCFSLFFLLYVGMGIIFGTLIELDPTEDVPFNPGIVFIVIGVLGTIITVVSGVLTLMAAKYLKEQRNYNFIFVIAVVNCLTGILGILLGVFTLIELSKPEIKQLFKTPNEYLPNNG